jgi:hypothetical protein
MHAPVDPDQYTLSQPNSQMTARYWCFTLNNYTEEDEQTLQDAFPEFLKGLQYGRELGSQEETPHLQGILQTNVPSRLAALQRRFGLRYHWERCRNISASIAYTAKDGDVFTIGQLGSSQQGRRTDLENAIADFKSHRSLSKLKDDHPVVYVKYPRGFSTLLDIPPRTTGPRVVWIYGSTGTGKTYSIIHHFPDIWISSGSLQWFDGYIGQESALLDDFRGSDCTFHYLLRLLDRYPLRVPIKGGFVEWVPKRIFITSAFGPRQTYSGMEDTRQLLRRIHILVHKLPGGEYVNESDQVGNNVVDTQSNGRTTPEFEALLTGDFFSGFPLHRSDESTLSDIDQQSISEL